MKIPDWVADWAYQHPLAESSQEATEAAAWYESVYGAGRTARRAALTSGDFTRIRALPEEGDAHDTRGLMVEEYLDEQQGDARPVLREGCFDRDQVAYVQEMVRYLGYDPGTPDGDFGPKTAEAVRAFQRDRGLVEDGEVGPRTWTELDRARGH
jgi:murein L,D-transpeptidase YcbB/YkuD